MTFNNERDKLKTWIKYDKMAAARYKAGNKLEKSSTFKGQHLIGRYVAFADQYIGYQYKGEREKKKIEGALSIDEQNSKLGTKKEK